MNITVTPETQSFTVTQVSSDITVTTPTGVEIAVTTARTPITVDNSIQQIDVSTGGPLTTDELIEGTDNLYFTTARSRQSISASGDLSYSSSTGVMSYTTPDTVQSLANHTTSDLLEGTNLYYTDVRATAAAQAVVDAIDYPVDSVNGETGAVVLTTTNIEEGNNLYYTTTRANNNFDGRLATKTTTDLAEGANKYYTTTRANDDFDTRFDTKDTDDLAEGTTNKYFSQAQARASISTEDLGGDGNLTYNVSTGVISYTGPTASEVRSHFSAGTGVTITDGVIAIGQSVATTADVTFNSAKISGSAGLLKADGSTFLNYSSGTGFKQVNTAADTGLFTSYLNLDNRVLYNTGSLTTTTTAANQLVDSFSKLAYRSANYLINIGSGGEYQVFEGMIIHNGVTAYLNAYGDLRTSVNDLAIITVAIVGNDVQILATPLNANTTFKIQKALMNV